MVENYFDQTVIHPIGLAAILLLGAMLVILPRRLALLPVLLLACFVSVAQRIVVFGFDFDFLRILVVFGWIRLLVRNEARGLRWNGIDMALTMLVVVNVALYTASRRTGNDFTNRVGWAFQTLGFYFLCRYLLQGTADLRTIARMFAMCVLPAAACFVAEFFTHRNLFSVFGGVPLLTWFRDGEFRCQGPFAHPIVAGVFWASILPLMASLWWCGPGWRKWAVIGTCGALWVVFTTKSSTPVMAVAFAVLGLAMYPLRYRLAAFRWGIAGCLLALHLVMKKPVWHLVARVTVFDASTGWHRYYLIDQCVRHFRQWWLMGTPSTANWDITDITNQYVLVAIESGLLGLITFLAMVWLAFKRVGMLYRSAARDPARAHLCWSLGAGMFVHCMNFIAVSYFGQANIVWYLTIALIASLDPVPSPVPAAAQRTRAPLPRVAAG